MLRQTGFPFSGFRVAGYSAESIFGVHRQNVPRQNVLRDKTSQDITSQGTKLPKGQNVPRDKTSHTNYQVFKNKFWVRKLAKNVRKWASSVDSIYDWGIPILGRIG